MSDQPIIFEERETSEGKRIGVARLNQPRSLNALSLTMIRLLHQQLTRWSDDESIVAVWLDAEGEKGFCAGGDIVAIYRSMTEHRDQNLPQDGITFFTEEYDLDYLIHTYPKPVVAWGHGIIMGGGLGIFVGASHRVVTETSRVAMPEVTIGLYPDVGASWFLNRAPGRTGLFLGLTGTHMNAADAIYAGLADRFIQNEKRDELLTALCKTDGLAGNASATVSQVLRDYQAQSADALPESPLRHCHDDIQSLTDADSLAGVIDRITSYDGNERLLVKAAKAPQSASPTSMGIFWKQFHGAVHASLAEVFRQELTLSIRCLQKGEFAEGIRALIIDKDKQPRWRYSSVTDLDPAWINGFFEPLS